jgi:hypothetical protein
MSNTPVKNLFCIWPSVFALPALSALLKKCVTSTFGDELHQFWWAMQLLTSEFFTIPQIFTLNIITAMISEMLEHLQHSTQLKPESWSHILKSSHQNIWTRTANKCLVFRSYVSIFNSYRRLKVRVCREMYLQWDMSTFLFLHVSSSHSIHVQFKSQTGCLWLSSVLQKKMRLLSSNRKPLYHILLPIHIQKQHYHNPFDATLSALDSVMKQ